MTGIFSFHDKRKTHTVHVIRSLAVGFYAHNTLSVKYQVEFACLETRTLRLFLVLNVWTSNHTVTATTAIQR